MMLRKEVFRSLENEIKNSSSWYYQKSCKLLKVKIFVNNLKINDVQLEQYNKIFINVRNLRNVG